MAKIIDRTGQKFNHLTIIKELRGGKVLCRCDCGTIKEFIKGDVVNGNTKSCGCMRKTTFIDRTGQKFNMLTIIKELRGGKVLCRCDCGNEKIMNKVSVINGYTKSCGCLLHSTQLQKIKSYVGQKFNHLTIIKELGSYKVLCRCDCGKEVIANKTSVINGIRKYCNDKNCPYKTKKLLNSSKMKDDIVGQKFNMLTILEEFIIKNPKGENIKKVRCRCDCGNELETEKIYVLSGHTKSCGCLRKKTFIDRTGQKFNHLTIIKELGGNKVLCRCDCGTIREFVKGAVVNGKTKSCGCIRKKRLP